MTRADQADRLRWTAAGLVRCLPGCAVVDRWPVDRWDHRCVVRVATVDRPPGPGGDRRWVAVEVDQDADVVAAGGDGPATRRVMVLVALGEGGRYGDPIQLDPDRAADVAGALLQAAARARPGRWRSVRRAAAAVWAATPLRRSSAP